MPPDPLSPSRTPVWVVEDSPRFRDALCALVEATPDLACPHAFETVEEALAALARTDPPAVVLMDIGLPGLSGIEGVKRVKAVSPATHVIMQTVYEDNEKVFASICAGASGYLLKSAPAGRIVEGIREVLGGGAPMNGPIARRVLEMFAHLAPPPAGDYALTAREREILQLLVDGLNRQQIAERLFLSYHTVITHVKNIYAKLQVGSRAGAVAKALQERLL